jgi:hypothetical protein
MKKFFMLKKNVFIIILFFVSLLVGLGCWYKNINTPYYEQTTSYYCGAATAQMILNSEKVGIYVASQDTLYDYIHDHNECSSGWASDPEGLKDVLNHYYPQGHFYVSTLSDADDANKKLAYTIDRYGVPPAILIYGCQHWVVVRGTMTSAQPTKAASYTISGFYVNDPWYGATSLGENEYIDMSDWNTNYFTGCGGWCGTSGSKYISVLDPDAVPNVKISYPKVLKERDRLLSVTEAKKFATNYVTQFKKQKDFAVKMRVESRIIRSSKIGTPVLVKRSDKKKQAYYIVPLQRGSRTSGAMLINAYSGQLKRVTYVKKPIAYTSILNQRTAKATFLRKLPQFKLQPIEKTMRKKGVSIKSRDLSITKMELVWAPSLRTQNPYYPLWKTTAKVKGESKTRVIGYMDNKGRVFHNLTSSKILGGGSAE